MFANIIFDSQHYSTNLKNLIIIFYLGISKNWEPHEKLPKCSVRTLLARFVDIITPPSRQLLTLLSSFCSNKEDEDRLKRLADVCINKDAKKYKNI